MRILGLDPGFANIGWCMGTLTDGLLVVSDLGTIETKKDTRKVLVSVDNMRRAREITEALAGLVWSHDGVEVVREVDCLCVEEMSYPRNASNAAKMAMTWGVISAVSEMWGLPVVQASPQQIKEAVTNSRKASKQMMLGCLQADYPEIEGLLAPIPSSRREHPVDALGAIVACINSEIVRAMS